MFNAQELKARQKKAIRKIDSSKKETLIERKSQPKEIKVNIVIPREPLKQDPSEQELSDDYNVYFGYVYIVDGYVVRSPIEGYVRDLKRELKARIVLNCQLYANPERQIGDEIILNDEVIMNYIQKYSEEVVDGNDFQFLYHCPITEAAMYLKEKKLRFNQVVFARSTLPNKDYIYILRD